MIHQGSIRELRAHGLVIVPAAPPPEPPARQVDAARQIFRLLMLAYHLRPCFCCGSREACEHREPEIELAIMGVGVRHG